MPYSSQIDKLFRRKAATPMNVAEIAHALEIPNEEYPTLEASLQTMEYSGRLVRVKASRYSLPSKAGLVVGKLDVTRSGDGYVIPLDRDQFKDDIRVTQENMGSAADGDLVAVSAAVRRGRFTQAVGKVEYVVKRYRTNFVGTYEEAGDEGIVSVDGGGAIRKIRVKQEGIVAAQPGEKVVVEIQTWARAGKNPTGIVIEVLGPADDPTTDTISIVREYALPESFSDEVLREAESIGEEVRPADLHNRLDLRKRTIITIDPVHAKDFDDAISIKRTPDGWLLGVHIADVSEYVRPGTALDESAYERGTSVYLPSRVIPMLPHAISNGIASLREGEDRLTKTVIMKYNFKGEILGYEVHKSVIRSTKRMTYEQASAVLAGRQPEGVTLTPEIFELLSEAAQLAKLLEQRRLEAGLLELDMPEVDVVLDGAGEVVGVKPVERDWSHKLIEMFMVAANEVIAEFMTARKLPHLRRSHEGPSEEDLQWLKSFLSGMGFVVRDTSDRFQLQSILKAAQGRPHAPLINLAVLKSMKRAEYTSDEVGHYALASDAYSHYTSPIRRYPDLIVHQILDEFLTGRFDEDRKHYWQSRLPSVALQSSQLERRADAAEQELTKLKVLRYLEKHADEDYDGIVTGVKPYGIFIELCNLIVDGFVHVSELPYRNVHFDQKGRRLVGSDPGGRAIETPRGVKVKHGRGRGDARKGGEASIRLGDHVAVKIKAIDLSSRKLDLILLGKESPVAREVEE